MYELTWIKKETSQEQPKKIRKRKGKEKLKLQRDVSLINPKLSMLGKNQLKASKTFIEFNKANV